MQSSVSFTLPISCQICLGKVKEPVTCSNQHVFCSMCMNAWLDRNNRCPTCRVEITSQSPLRKIIGGLLQNDTRTKCQATTRELRRTRFELVLREYEEENFQLQNELDKLQKENEGLKRNVENSGSSNTSAASCSSDSFEKYTESCSRCCNIKDLEELLDLTKKLQSATDTYSGIKERLVEAEKINEELKKSNDDLKIENEKIRLEFRTRSPLKFGRLTVATLESRLEAALKEVDQLKKAMERNDSYTENLENELKQCRAKLELCGGNELVEADNEKITLPSRLNDSSDDILSQACDIAGAFTDDQKPSLSLLPSIELGCSVACDETSKASSFLELQALEDPFSNFASPPDSIDSEFKSTFSRKLDFDETGSTQPSTSQDVCDSFFPVEDESYQKREDSLVHQSGLDPSPLLRKCNSGSPWLQSSTATKTVINAGGSLITMSQLTADDQDAFARPSSAPSRTFLLSGSRFSALKPLDPPIIGCGFQPVKCISPMQTSTSPPSEHRKRSLSPDLRLVSPSDVVDLQYRKNEGSKPDDDMRGREALSRVNILKRKSGARTEGRRKQKFHQKLGVDFSFRSPLKRPKLEPK